MLFSVLMHKLVAEIPLGDGEFIICYIDEICHCVIISQKRMQRFIDGLTTRAHECGLVISAKKTGSQPVCYTTTHLSYRRPGAWHMSKVNIIWGELNSCRRDRFFKEGRNWNHWKLSEKDMESVLSSLNFYCGCLWLGLHTLKSSHKKKMVELTN